MWILWTLPPNHQQSFDAVCDQLKTHVIRRVQTLTADVMGIEMSIRDQKGRTSPLDSGDWGCITHHPIETNLYTSDILCQGSEWVGWVRWIIQQAFRWIDRSLKSKIHHVTQTKNYYEIYWRTINFSCIDGLVYVWLSCTDCGCLESATRMGCDSNPVPQTNLGLTNLYSLLLLDGSYLWIDYP